MESRERLREDDEKMMKSCKKFIEEQVARCAPLAPVITVVHVDLTIYHKNSLYGGKEEVAGIEVEHERSDGESMERLREDDESL